MPPQLINHRAELIRFAARKTTNNALRRRLEDEPETVVNLGRFSLPENEDWPDITDDNIALSDVEALRIVNRGNSDTLLLDAAVAGNVSSSLIRIMAMRNAENRVSRHQRRSRGPAGFVERIDCEPWMEGAGDDCIPRRIDFTDPPPHRSDVWIPQLPKRPPWWKRAIARIAKRFTRNPWRKGWWKHHDGGVYDPNHPTDADLKVLIESSLKEMPTELFKRAFHGMSQTPGLDSLGKALNVPRETVAGWKTDNEGYLIDEHGERVTFKGKPVQYEPPASHVKPCPANPGMSDLDPDDETETDRPDADAPDPVEQIAEDARNNEGWTTAQHHNATLEDLIKRSIDSMPLRTFERFRQDVKRSCSFGAICKDTPDQSQYDAYHQELNRILDQPNNAFKKARFSLARALRAVLSLIPTRTQAPDNTTHVHVDRQQNRNSKNCAHIFKQHDGSLPNEHRQHKRKPKPKPKRDQSARSKKSTQRQTQGYSNDPTHKHAPPDPTPPAPPAARPVLVLALPSAGDELPWLVAVRPPFERRHPVSGVWLDGTCWSLGHLPIPWSSWVGGTSDVDSGELQSVAAMLAGCSQ